MILCPGQFLHSPVDQVDPTKSQRGVHIISQKIPVARAIDYIDPIQGKIAGAAEEELTLKRIMIPAVYTNGTASNNCN